MLPVEMLFAILGFCDVLTLLNVRLACREFLLIIESPWFWSNTRITTVGEHVRCDTRTAHLLRAALRHLRAGEARAQIRKEVEKLAKDKNRVHISTKAIETLQAGVDRTDLTDIVVGDHVRLHCRAIGFRTDAIVITTGNEPREAEVILMTVGGRLARSSIADLHGLRYNVVFNRMADYKGNGGYVESVLDHASSIYSPSACAARAL
jgi:hypothetical protein